MSSSASGNRDDDDTLALAAPNRDTGRVRALRHILLVLFFLGLATIEIVHGIHRIDSIRARHHERALEIVGRRHVELARGLENLLRAEREHSRYLAAMPLVRRLVASPTTAVRRELEAELLPYLVSFGNIDRIRVLDESGVELVRCERHGKGAGALPPPLLATTPDDTVVGLAGDLPPGEVARSHLILDDERVEVPEADRQVIHFASKVVVAGKERHARGFVALTVYAAPILDTVRRFSPITGVGAYLVDSTGDSLGADRDADPSDAAERAELRAYLVGDGTRDKPLTGDAATFVDRISGDPEWYLVARVPESSLESASGELRVEYAWVIGAMVLITLVLAVAAFFFVRLSIREMRLREAERQEHFERHMQISERLGSLGLLTAGVAHEINNPLEGIGNYLSLLEKTSLPTQKRMRYLELVRKGFQRIRDIVRDLSDFSRPAVGDGEANLVTVIEQAIRLSAYDRKLRHVTVNLEAAGSPPLLVQGDAGRLEQVFLNLLLNAGRAMDAAGTIRIAAETTTETGADRQRQVVVRVDDEGPGIEAAILDKIFDPFFTTTEGTGLGLAVSYGIIRAHGGTLSAENLPERGTRFTIRLPTIAASGGGRRASNADGQGAPQAEGTAR